MFGRKKANKLIEDIDRYFDLMDQSVLVFKSGVRNYLYSNKYDFNDNLMKMSSLDSEADVLRREKETPFIPKELNQEFMKLTEFSTLAERVIGMSDKPLANE